MKSENQTLKNEANIYSHCTNKGNAKTVSDLCEHCPIPGIIAECLPRIEAEIEEQREGNTPAGFIAYCEAALNGHIKNATQFANDLANPGRVPPGERGQIIEHKLWNASLCQLYKTELLNPQPSHALSLPIAAAPQPEASAAGSAVGEPSATSPWAPLLVGELKIDGLFSVFADCGLLTKAGELTPLGRADGVSKARKAPWAGTLQALMQADLLDKCAAAVCRALADPAGGVQVRLNEGTLRDYSTKAGTYLEAANNCLKERGLLRK